MNTHQKRMRWLVRLGFKLQRAGISWVCRLGGHVVNASHSKRELVRLVFREVNSTM